MSQNPPIDDVQVLKDALKVKISQSPVLQDLQEERKVLLERLERMNIDDLKALEELLHQESADWESLLEESDQQREGLLEQAQKESQVIQKDAASAVAEIQSKMTDQDKAAAEALLEGFDT